MNHSLDIPIPANLRPSFSLFHDHLKQALQTKRKSKERLRTIGMGGTRKHQTEAPTSTAGGREISRMAFLHVPIPTALRPALSCSSRLTLTSHPYTLKHEHVGH